MFAALAYVLFCALCTVYAFKRHPIWGLYFYLATIYVHPPSRWWVYMLPELRWSLISAVVAVLAVVVHRGRLQAKPLWLANAPAIILSIYAAWMWFQCAWALDLETHLEGATKFVKYLIAFWIVYRLIDTKEMLRNLLLAHVAGCTLLGLMAQFIGRDGGRLDGVGGPGLDDANTLGMYLATGVIASLGLFLSEKGWKRWGLLAVMAVIGNGFVLANSRGAFLGLLAGSLTLMFCKARAHRKQFWLLALAGLVGFAVVVDKVFIDRMFTIGDVVEESEDADMSARSRMELYKAQLRMAADYPLGAGYRGTATLSPFYLDRKWLARDNGIDDPDAARTSHNTLMSTLVEQGFPGFVLFLVLIGWLFSAGLRVRRMNQSGVDPGLITLSAATCGTLMVVIVAGSATDYLMAEVQFWMFAALVSALQLGGAMGTVRPPIGGPALQPIARPQLRP
ncbi:O-antigen ligase family protein [Piscinibacter sp. XHJ-5]|uniref:O-antigen ligase family protein n=1 Tax=Piscinibacter sp. XHJ-5 TaxID=3037797 RepID=UPI002452D186|nr:O-antigen ligase family protein [Piscinibacter sp. XHJ-5]